MSCFDHFESCVRCMACYTSWTYSNVRIPIYFPYISTMHNIYENVTTVVDISNIVLFNGVLLNRVLLYMHYLDIG